MKTIPQLRFPLPKYDEVCVKLTKTMTKDQEAGHQRQRYGGASGRRASWVTLLAAEL